MCVFAQKKDSPFRNANLPNDQRCKGPAHALAREDLAVRLQLSRRSAAGCSGLQLVERSAARCSPRRRGNHLSHKPSRWPLHSMIHCTCRSPTPSPRKRARSTDLATALDRPHNTMGPSPSGHPNINIFRDPRWDADRKRLGDPLPHRAHGFCLYQRTTGIDPRYLKTSACAKHLLAASQRTGSEPSYLQCRGRRKKTCAKQPPVCFPCARGCRC